MDLCSALVAWYKEKNTTLTQSKSIKFLWDIQQIEFQLDVDVVPISCV